MAMDASQIIKALTEIGSGLRKNFPEIQGAHIILQLPLEQYVQLAKDCPEAVAADEPFIEFSVGTTKLIFTNDEAILLMAEKEAAITDSDNP